MNYTKKQLDHIVAFNEMTKPANEVDFNYYEDSKRFGPWNPYWHVYNFISKFSKNGNKKLLLVGCGNGRDALIYANLGFDVYGFDISDQAIEYARTLAEKYHFKIAFSIQSAEEIDYPSDFFDLIVGVNVLHHIDIDQSMKQFCRVLKKGGYAVFKEPLLTPLKTKFRNSIFVKWIIPESTKQVFQKTKYNLVEGEKNLDKYDFAIIKKYFYSVDILRWRVIGSLDFFIHRFYLEKIDWALFKIFPFVRKFGDQSVLILQRHLHF